MAESPLAAIVSRLVRGLPRADGTSDDALLARFVGWRDEAAFELLVWRHAGLVHRVCRSVLRDHHAAEDAAQATFLALARKAGSYAGRGPVVGWLYRVARRVSVRLARQRARLPDRADALDLVPSPEDRGPEADTADEDERAAARPRHVDRTPDAGGERDDADGREHPEGERDVPVDCEDDGPGDEDGGQAEHERRRCRAPARRTRDQGAGQEHHRGRGGETDVVEDHESSEATSPEARKRAPSR